MLTVTEQTASVLTTSLGEMTIGGASDGVTVEGRFITLLDAYLSLPSPVAPADNLVFVGTYPAFTVAVRFSVAVFDSPTYVMCTDYPSAGTMGVNLVVTETQLLVLHYNDPTAQWYLQYQFSGQGECVCVCVCVCVGLCA